MVLCAEVNTRALSLAPRGLPHAEGGVYRTAVVLPILLMRTEGTEGRDGGWPSGALTFKLCSLLLPHGMLFPGQPGGL